MAIAVNVRRSMIRVKLGEVSLKDATLGEWTHITDEALARYGDVLIGIVGNEVVSVYDVTGHVRTVPDNKVIFEGNESEEFKYLIGGPSPVPPWTRGQARPIKYLHTNILRGGDAPVEEDPNGNRRAVVRGYILTVDSDGIATVEPPRGGAVMVLAPNDSREAIEV